MDYARIETRLLAKKREITRLRAWFPWAVLMIIALVLMATGSVLLLVAGVLMGGSALTVVPRPRKLSFSPEFINNRERSEGIPLSDFSQWGLKPPDRFADNEAFLARTLKPIETKIDRLNHLIDERELLLPPFPSGPRPRSVTL